MLQRFYDKFSCFIGLRGFFALLVGVAIVAPTCVRAQTIPQTTGIFAINPVSSKGVIASSILTDPYVKGILYTQGWNQIETKEGVYNWSVVDNVLSQAAANHKLVTLGVMAGYQTPSWVYTDGAASFKFLWDKPKFGPALCSVQMIPVPWDSTFLQKWETFVQAMGARYSSNPTVVSVAVYGVNFHSIEASLPVSVSQLITSTTVSCTGYNYPTMWQAAGYTRTKVETALFQMQNTFQTAFPHTQLLAGLNPGGFPPIDQNGNLISGQVVDSQIPIDLLASAAVALGPQYSGGNGGLGATAWIWSLLAGYASTINTGYQTNAALGSSLPIAINAALYAGARWLQLYQSDITLAANQTAIQSAAASLH